MDFIISFCENILIYGIPVVLAITLHEAAHGFVALKCGDDTAYLMGRVSFNPLKHIDLFGTLIIPILLVLSHAPFIFGYAKPVPVNFQRLRHPRRDTIFVALAGPLTNIFLAFLSACLFYLLPLFPLQIDQGLQNMLSTSVLINCVLAIFNMIPILPLDGGRIFGELLPTSLRQDFMKTERFGMLIIILLITFPFLTELILGFKVPLLSWILFPFLNGLLKVISMISGIPLSVF